MLHVVLKILGKIRLVPVTIFAATLMLTMKVADIFDDFNLQNIPLQLSKAVAQDQTSKPNTTAQDDKKSQQKATIIFLSRYRNNFFSKAILRIFTKIICHFQYVINRFERLSKNQE